MTKARGVLLWCHSRLGTIVGAVLLMAVLELLTTRATALWFRDAAAGGTTWWPAAGVGVAVLIRYPRRWWPLLVLTLAVTNAISNMISGPWPAALGFAVANGVEAGLTATVLVKARNGKSGWLETPLQAGKFLLGACGAVFLAGMVVAARCFISGPADNWLSVTRGYVFGHAIGLVALAPAFLLTGHRTRIRPREWSEFSAVLAVGVSLCWWTFLLPQTTGRAFLLMLPLVWAAKRLPALLATLTALVTVSMASYGTAHHLGSFAAGTTPLERLLTLQLFLATTSAATLMLVLSSRSRSRLIDRLRDKEATLSAAIEGAVVGIFTLQLSGPSAGVITGVNPAFCEVTGYRADDLIGATPALFTDVSDEAEVLRMTDSIQDLEQGRVTTMRRDKRLVRADGASVWVELSISAVSLTTGERFALVHVQDLSERKEREDHLERLALHDTLTGLPNRALVADRLDLALRQRARSGRATGVIYVDLDGFKQVNDLYGHAAGDTVLKLVARRLQDGVRPGDTVGRLGGDEFVVCCPDLPSEAPADSLAVIADRLQGTFSTPMRLNGTHEVTVGASIGTVVSAPASTVEQLLHDSDQLMYEYKRARADTRTQLHPRTASSSKSPTSV